MKHCTTVAFLGPEGSFSHEAARQMYPQAEHLLAVNGPFRNVLEAVATGEATHAVVPFYNTHLKDVLAAQNALTEFLGRLYIEGFHLLKIDHNLAVAPAFANLRQVSTKFEVYDQCKGWLMRNPCERLEATSTAGALVELLRESADVRAERAVICSKFAVDIHGGIIREQNIHDPGNVTMFASISGTEPPPFEDGADRILVCLTCSTSECCDKAMIDFMRAGHLVKSSMPFRAFGNTEDPTRPIFMEFGSSTSTANLEALLGAKNRKYLGTFRTPKGLAANFKMIQDIATGKMDIGKLDSDEDGY